MNFVYVFLLFFLISSVSILWPLFRGWREQKKQLREDARSDYSGEVVKDRVRELEEIKAIGEISEAEFKSLQRDLEQTISAEESLSYESSPAIAFGEKSRYVLVGLCVLLPLFVYIAYAQFGAKKDWDITQASQALAKAKPESLEEERLQLIQKVKARLKDTPENGHLLFMLANLSSSIGDHDESVSAYKELKAMFPESPVVLAELAQSLFLRAGNVITPEVRDNTKLALELDPNLPTALGFAGIDAFQNGLYKEAILFWQRAVRQLDPQSAASQFLSQGIARAQLALETSGAKEEDATSKVKADTPELVVKVALGEEVSEVSGEETVFVYARAWQGAKIPLAIQRISASELPTSIRLNKDMAMAEGMDITTAPQLEVVARLSKSGGASPQSGDWIGSFGPVILGAEDIDVELQIKELIP